MKKKMAILGTLLIAVIGTGFSVSGTYAKYITEVNLSDEARVAKWQIGLSEDVKQTLDLFHSSYDFGTDGTVVKALSRDLVKEGDAADALDNVVAPGTKGQYTFAIEGTLETAYTLKVSTTGSKNGVKIDYTTPVVNDGVTVDEPGTYEPVKFFLAKGADKANLTTESITGWYNFKTLTEELEKLYTGVYQPGTLVAADNTYTIYWKWDFETGSDDAERTFNNKLDTKLGNEIAKDPTSHVVTLNINITAEQVGGNYATETVVTPTPGA